MPIIILGLVFYQLQETNPVKLVLDTGFKVYQKFISPGQGDVCNFYPSCSYFSRSAIRRYGLFWGSLMAADRLMRCNPWAYRNYKLHYRNIRYAKLFDPVENNFIFGKILSSESRDSLLINVWRRRHR